VKRSALLIVLALAFGCAGLKPTTEMQEYQSERGTRDGEEIKVRYPELVKNAESWDGQAREAQDKKEPEDMSYYGHVAWLWWESAQLRSQAQDMDAERAQLEKDIEQVGKELAEAKKREKLAKANLERMEQIIALEGKVADSQEVAAAREEIASAMKAIADAQAVDADVHAKATFAIAEKKLKMATDALGKNKTKDAISYAIEAKTSAETAKEEASPKYATTEADQAKLNRSKALFDALAEVSGSQRAMVEGGVQITLVETFSASGVTIDPSHEANFNKVAESAKTFNDFSLIIEGHTDSKGSKTKNLQLSESRAQSVMSHLAAQGVSPSRMSAVGKGAAEPVADNKTKEGRSKNRRIEILFVPSGG
jgi:outer membrane protein OmpA-like peptidoglycan-associated protein